MSEIRILSTVEVSGLVQKEEVNIIDIRPVDAYNGWRLKDETREGHITGATSLPAKWAAYMDWIEVVRHKQIVPENQVVLYGYESVESLKVARLFIKAGYSNVAVYTTYLY